MTRRRAIAVMALATALAPWVTTAAVSLHVMADSYEAADHDPGRDLDGPLHGHRHETATPEHQHFVIAPAAQFALRAAPAVFAHAVLSAAPSAAHVSVESPAPRWDHRDLGPPPPARSAVILRI